VYTNIGWFPHCAAASRNNKTYTEIYRIFRISILPAAIVMNLCWNRLIFLGATQGNTSNFYSATQSAAFVVKIHFTENDCKMRNTLHELDRILQFPLQWYIWFIVEKNTTNIPLPSFERALTGMAVKM